MQYIPPFSILKDHLTIATEHGELRVSGSYQDFLAIIRRLLAGIQVDERWYLERYPDIADAITRGIVTSAQQHFVDDGYFERRQPFPIRVNERWYLQNNTGIADFVRQGKLESGQQHFDENGYQEGRLPFPL